MGRLASPGWIASHLFALAMVVLMTNLGFWQLRRLDDRRLDNAQIISAMSQPPSDLAAHLDSRGLPVSHTAVAAQGVYLSEAEVRVANRSSGGQPGFWLATPLRLADGRAVAVVRGFVPRRNVTGLDDRSAAAPAGQATVVGLAFESVPGGRIAQGDGNGVPEISRMDLASFEQASGVDVVDVWIRLRNQSPPQPDGLPEPVPDPDLGEGPAPVLRVPVVLLLRRRRRRLFPDPAPHPQGLQHLHLEHGGTLLTSPPRRTALAARTFQR